MLNRYLAVFASLNSHDVKYLVIGGIAAFVHGGVRPTFDLDILIEATPDNAGRLLRAFEEIGLGTAALTTPESLAQHEITIFRDRLSIDVQTKTPGLNFADAWLRRRIVEHHGQAFNVLSRDDLLASKRASARPRDLDDVRALEAGDADVKPSDQ